MCRYIYNIFIHHNMYTLHIIVHRLGRLFIYYNVFYSGGCCVYKCYSFFILRKMYLYTPMFFFLFLFFFWRVRQLNSHTNTSARMRICIKPGEFRFLPSFLVSIICTVFMYVFYASKKPSDKVIYYYSGGGDGGGGRWWCRSRERTCSGSSNYTRVRRAACRTGQIASVHQ